MDSVKILHCADVHLGALENAIGAVSESRQAETLITFEKIIMLAKENDVNIMLIAGDLFNSNNLDKAFVDRVFECFASIPEIKIVYAAGNHDPLNADSPFKKYTAPKNIYVLDTKDDCIEFADLNTCVYGKSFKEVYMQGEPCFSIKPNTQFINLMCIHGDLRSDLGSDYNSITNDFVKSSGMNYIALGHVHKRTDIIKTNNTYLAYCGCPEGQGFDELGEKGVYLGEISKNECKLQFIPTAKRMHLLENVDVSSLTTSNDITNHIIQYLKQKYSESFSENLYKIVLTGQVDEGVNVSTPEIASRLNEILYFAKVCDKTEVKVDFDTLSQEQTLKGVFVKNILSKIKVADESEKQILKAALNIGLKAFSGEVNYDET